MSFLVQRGVSTERQTRLRSRKSPTNSKTMFNFWTRSVTRSKTVIQEREFRINPDYVSSIRKRAVRCRRPSK
ncbi:hypothetical protein JG688_00017776 [Phytophthora aleatoria]|uniref:Uncharacterized protein n=1 Tax=Phytophthora aleatoria TaxID=2496075 RepID=A0A8J5I0E6_9STRA|nr:hypothetical protein JG688_00017776 [Phytophthora aleatoria]